MAVKRLSRLQRRILAWLRQEAQRTGGTMAASHQDLVHALGADKGNISPSLASLETKGLIRIARTAGGKAEAVDLTPAGRQEVVKKERLASLMTRKSNKPPSTKTPPPKSMSGNQPLEQPQSSYKWLLSSVAKLMVILLALRGGIQVVGQDIRSLRDLYGEMFPHLSVELKPNGTAISKAEFKLTNEGPGELRDVEHRFLIDYVGDRSFRPYPGERPTFRDNYSLFGNIPPKGTITMGILHAFHQLMESGKWTRIGICHDLVFHTFPFDWIS